MVVFYLPLIFDLSANLLAFFTAYYLRNYGVFRFFLDEVQPLPVYLSVLPVSVGLFVLVLYLKGMYRRRNRLSFASELRGMFNASSQWWLLLMAFSYLIKYDYSRLIVGMYFFLTIVLVSMSRYLARDIQLRMIKQNKICTNVLVLGAGRVGREVARRLARYRPLGYRVRGFLDDEVQRKSVLGKIEDLDLIVSAWNISEVYIANPALSHEKILNIVAKSKNPEIRFKIASNVFNLATGSIDLLDLETIPSLNIHYASPSVVSAAIKRLMDIAFSVVLIAVMAPLIIMAAVLIKFTSKGPIVLTQERVGFRGRHFDIYKFRTMYNETPLFADPPDSLDDNRITAVGKFLRKTSLDELPQMINVLKGEMSLVGPRPEMPYKIENYREWQKKRFAVKPGITGLWQVLGRKDLPLEENLEYDFYYINNQSLQLDLEILLRTIPVVLFGKGAY